MVVGKCTEYDSDDDEDDGDDTARGDKFAAKNKLDRSGRTADEVAEYVLANMADNVEDEAPLRELALLANHRSVGITILVLAIVRIEANPWRSLIDTSPFSRDSMNLADVPKNVIPMSSTRLNSRVSVG